MGTKVLSVPFSGEGRKKVVGLQMDRKENGKEEKGEKGERLL